MTIDKAFPVERIVAQASHMAWTFEHVAAGVVSETPDEPCWLKARPDMPGYYEMADGHHRLVEALLRGERTIVADLDDEPDDEPLEEPFYDFNEREAV